MPGQWLRTIVPRFDSDPLDIDPVGWPYRRGIVRPPHHRPQSSNENFQRVRSGTHSKSAIPVWRQMENRFFLRQCHAPFFK